MEHLGTAIVAFVIALVIVNGLVQLVKLLFRKKKDKRNKKYNVTVFLPEGEVRHYGPDMISCVCARKNDLLIRLNDGVELDFDHLPYIVETKFDSPITEK